MSQKTVAITGCSEGGIGAALAEEFARVGYIVYATARNPAKMARLSKSKGITLVTLDPTSPESVAEAYSTISSATSGRLDVLVNNAGQTIMYPVLDFDIEEAKKMYDINVFGAMRVTQTFSPLVIAAKGTLVYTCSISSMVRAPYLGVYAGSKAALAQIANTLRSEMRPFGVKVISVMTGAVETRTIDHHKEKYSLPANSIYKPIEKQVSARARGDEGVKRISPAEYAKYVVEEVVKETNGLIWKGGYAAFNRLMSGYLPVWLWDGMAAKRCGLEELSALNEKKAN